MTQSVSLRAWQAAMSRLKAQGRTVRGTAAWRLLAKSPELRSVKHAIFGGGSSNRYYIPRHMAVEPFFAELERRNVRYVVLRWFEELPRIWPGEDLDLLVHEDDASKMAGLLARIERRGAVPCDVYSSQGGFAAGRGNVAYYPPRMAEQIITRSVRHPSGALVPCPDDHFHSLAFHALYHKGFDSGIPLDEQASPGPGSEHDYTTTLARIAEGLGLELTITMTDLDRYLAKVGWRPPLDTLAKWSKGNEWCRHLYEEGLADIDAPEGLVVAIVRQEAADATDHIAEIFRSAGFHVTNVLRLDHAAAERASQQLRGGNWGRGLFPQSAGVPYAAIVAVDPSPIPPSPKLLAQHPGIDNARIKKIKSDVRDWWNHQVPPSRRCNVLHTSDSAAQAADYLAVLGINANHVEHACLSMKP